MRHGGRWLKRCCVLDPSRLSDTPMTANAAEIASHLGRDIARALTGLRILEKVNYIAAFTRTAHHNHDQ